MRLPGIAAAPGIAIASATVRREAQLPIGERARAGPQEELARLAAAISETRAQLQAIQATVRSRMGDEGVRILQAQVLMLADPMLVKPITDQIEHEGRSAEAAVDGVVSDLAGMMAAAGDAYLRERATDIRDLGRRLLDNLAGRTAAGDAAGIVVAANLTPSAAALLDPEKVAGIATEEGGATSHAAILARALNIPAVVGVKGLMHAVHSGDCVVVDGGQGEVLVRPDAATVDSYRRRQAARRESAARFDGVKDLPAVTRDGFRVEVAANVGAARDVARALACGAESIGLFRTEFLFLNRETPPGEEEQFAVYKDVLLRMAPRRVIIRTMDFGADKESPFAGVAAPPNPALGLRGIRLSLRHQDIFLAQLRALAKAAPFGNLGIMLPMVANLAEIRRAKQLLEQAGIPRPGVSLGIMVETPAAAVQAEDFAREVDFFSIGTNDLTQYVLAVDRLNEEVAQLYETFHPAVLRLIRDVCAAAQRAGKWTGVCGEMAGDPRAVPLLAGLGVSELSMSPSSIPRVKTLIRRLSKAEAAEAAADVTQLRDAGEVKARLEAFLRERVEENDRQIGDNS